MTKRAETQITRGLLTNKILMNEVGSDGKLKKIQIDNSYNSKMNETRTKSY